MSENIRSVESMILATEEYLRVLRSRLIELQKIDAVTFNVLPLELVYEIISYIPDHGFHVNSCLHRTALLCKTVDYKYSYDYYRYCGIFIVQGTGIRDILNNCINLVSKDPRNTWEYEFAYTIESDDDDDTFDESRYYYKKTMQKEVDKKVDMYDLHYSWIIKFLKKIASYVVYSLLANAVKMPEKILRDIGIDNISRFSSIQKSTEEMLDIQVIQLYALMVTKDCRLLDPKQFETAVIKFKIDDPVKVAEYIIATYGSYEHIRQLAVRNYSIELRKWFNVHGESSRYQDIQVDKNFHRNCRIVSSKCLYGNANKYYYRDFLISCIINIHGPYKQFKSTKSVEFNEVISMIEAMVD